MDFITLTSVCNGFTVFITLTSVCNGFVFKYVCFHEIFSSTLPNHGIYTQIFSLIDFKLLYMNATFYSQIHIQPFLVFGFMQIANLWVSQRNIRLFGYPNLTLCNSPTIKSNPLLSEDIQYSYPTFWYLLHH